MLTGQDGQPILKYRADAGSDEIVFYSFHRLYIMSHRLTIWGQADFERLYRGEAVRLGEG